MAEDLFTGVLPFVHTAEASSFRRAAAELGVTTAAISKSIAKLEARLGVKLLVRTSRTVALTPEGALYLERCRQAVESLVAGRALVAEAAEAPAGELRITLSPILARVVVRGLPLLLARHPRLAVRVSTTDRVSALAQERLDVAVRIGAREDSALVSRVLLRPRWATVASPAYLARKGQPASPEALARHDCLRFVGPSGRPTGWSFDGADVVQVSGPFDTDDGDQLVDAAIAGAGIAQVLDFMVAEPIREGRLVPVLDGFTAPGPPVHAVSTPERARTPNVRAAIAFLADRFAALGLPGRHGAGDVAG